MRHAAESVAESVAFRTRNNFDAQVAFGNSHGDAGHFLEVCDKIVKSSSERANLVVAVNVNILIKIARVADFACDGDEMGKRKNDRFGSVVGNQDAEQNREKSADGAEDGTPVTGAFSGFRGFVKILVDLRSSLIENR